MRIGEIICLQEKTDWKNPKICVSIRSSKDRFSWIFRSLDMRIRPEAVLGDFLILAHSYFGIFPAYFSNFV